MEDDRININSSQLVVRKGNFIYTYQVDKEMLGKFR